MNNTTNKFNCECCICKKPLKRSPSQLKALKDGKPVCSRTCMGIKKTKKYTEPKYDCCICGIKFYRAKNQIEQAKNEGLTCSKECANKYKSKLSYDKMSKQVGTDFKEWLVEQYWKKELPTSTIANFAYGKPKNAPNILGWMKKLDIPSRTRTDAVALQWKDNFERRFNQSVVISDLWGAETVSRKKLIAIMQTDEYKLKQSIAKTGEKNGMYGMTGEKSSQWNPNLTEEDRLHSRKYPEYDDWRNKVFKRDGYVCQICKHKENRAINAHHINGYHWDKHSRTEVDNGITLCDNCHKGFHKIYGYGDNDLFQFSQYMDQMKVN